MWKFFKTLKQSAMEFSSDGCMSSGAAIAYYAIFALPPLAMLVYLTLGYAGVSQERINESIKQRLGLPSAASAMAGGESQDQKQGGREKQAGNDSSLSTLAERTQTERATDIGTIGGLIGVGVLIFTATGLFGELQVALNRAWGVQPDSDQGGIRRFFMKRLFSMGLIVTMVMLLLLSMLLTTLLNNIYGYVQGAVPSGMNRFFSFAIDAVVTFAVATLLFAAVFKLLPDVDIEWRNLWVGAAATAFLFVLGKGFIAWYLQRADLGSSWGGATASLIAILAWLYYTSLIVLFGAELTQVWAREFGTGFQPTAGAQRAGKANQPGH
jgi:membrane protein